LFTVIYKPIEWLDGRVKLLDQTRLPAEEVYIETTDYRIIAVAIKELKIRGAPAIGVAGAYGIALGALEIKTRIKEEFKEKVTLIINEIASTRPTARNLFHATERMERVVQSGNDTEQIKTSLIAEAIRIHEEEAAATEKISGYGVELLQDGFTVLTHCNTGPLATTGYGTALGVIIYAKMQGKNIKVFADETRPLLQGARLTTWELKKAGIPVTLITDSMAGSFMNSGRIDCAIVGADRIASNGDTANKIGTYSVAVLAKEHNIPFYVAAPTTTIDTSLATGKEIPIEQRNPVEVSTFAGVKTAPGGIDIANPAFDVTPHRYITAIITERGIIREPYNKGIGRVIQ